jgi:hypothetical protein
MSSERHYPPQFDEDDARRHAEPGRTKLVLLLFFPFIVLAKLIYDEVIGLVIAAIALLIIFGTVYKLGFVSVNSLITMAALLVAYIAVAAICIVIRRAFRRDESEE